MCIRDRFERLRDSEKASKNIHNQLILAYSESIQKMKNESKEKRNKDIEGLARVTAAVDMVCKEIEKVLLIPALNKVKAYLEMARPDPANPSQPDRDQLKDRNLAVIHLALTQRIRNSEDKISALADLFRIVEGTPVFPSDNDAYNYYMLVIRRLKAKDITNITATDLMALKILVSMTKDKQEKFMTQQKLKEDIRAARAEHEDPSMESRSQAEERNITLMEKVSRFITSNDAETQRRLAFARAAPPKTDRGDHKEVKFEFPKHAGDRRTDREVRASHQKVLAAQIADQDYINEEIRKGIAAQLSQQQQQQSVLAAMASGRGSAIQYCNDFQQNKCTRESCRFVHEPDPRFVKPPVPAASTSTRPMGGGGPSAGGGAGRGAGSRDGGRPGPGRSGPGSSPAPIGPKRIKAVKMWDADGKICCYKGPYFLPHVDGECSSGTGCQYSHKRPIYTTRPEHIRVCLSVMDMYEPFEYQPGECFTDFMFGLLPRQVARAKAKADRAAFDEAWANLHPNLDATDIFEGDLGFSSRLTTCIDTLAGISWFTPVSVVLDQDPNVEFGSALDTQRFIPTSGCWDQTEFDKLVSMFRAPVQRSPGECFMFEEDDVDEVVKDDTADEVCDRYKTSEVSLGSALKTPRSSSLRQLKACKRSRSIAGNESDGDLSDPVIFTDEGTEVGRLGSNHDVDIHESSVFTDEDSGNAAL